MSYRPSHRHSLLTLAIVLFVAAAVPAAVHGAAPPMDSPSDALAAVVYWIGLRPLATAGLDGIDAAYDQLQPLLRQLRTEGRVLGFQFHPNRGAVRVVAVSGGVDGLDARPEVDEIEAEGPHPHAPERPWPAEEVIRWQAHTQSVVPAQTYGIRGTVRDHNGTPVEDAYVSTGYADPAYTGDWTDAGGAYTLTVSVAGAYHVSAYKSGYPDSDERAVTVPPDATGVDLTFPPTYTISGVVRDQAGNPVGGAQVYGGIDTVTTAADGTFAAVAGPGEHDLSAYKDGYQSPYDVLVPLPPAATGVGVPLLRENGAIQGRVVDDQGVPVIGAWVYAENAVCGDWGDGAAQTTAGGAYTLTVPAGVYQVRASKDGYVPTPPQQVDVPSGLPAAQANLVLDRALYHIRGTVRDGAGQPLGNAQVNASACGLLYGASTSASGAYTLTMGAGLYSVSASKTDYTGGAVQMVSVPPDATDTDFILTALTFYTITGRVTTPQGQPIEDVWVATTYGEDLYSDSDRTDVNGRYTLRVPAGTYHVRADKHGYTWPEAQVVSVPPSRSGVDFVLSPTGLEIRGTVRDSSGKPLPMAYVYSFLPEQHSSWVTDVYYDGTYVRGMSAGTHSVYARANCYVRASVLAVTLPPTRTGIDFFLTIRDQLISGQVRDTTGAALCGATVSTVPGGNNSYSDSTKRNGLYALQVPSGAYAVRATKAGYGTAPDRAVTVPPYARGIDFALQAPDHSIQGTVRDTHGTAIPGAAVTASGSGGSVSVTSGADGRYTIAVLSGSWKVSAGKGGYMTFTGVQTVSIPPDRTGVDFLLVAQGDVRRVYVPVAIKP